jgi:hypothetical protein
MSTDPGSHRRVPPRRHDTNRTGHPRLFLAGVALALTVAACGGGSPQVASLGGTTTTTPVSAAGRAGGPKGDPTAFTAFTACMRAHGVTSFPDPVVNGNQISIRINPSIAGSPHFASARAACAHYLPGLAKGRPPAITAADQEDYLKAAACMRSHGFPNFPDPVFANGGVRFNIPSTLNPDSPAVKRAILTCRKLIPSGLPYSESS